MHPLLQLQQELHDHATALLNDVLIPLLTTYGKVTVGGSYAYQLLNYPDLDIDVVTEVTSKEMFAELSKQLIILPMTSKFRSGDRVNFPHEHNGNRPTGYWLSPQLNYGQRTWSIDIWLQTGDQYTGATNHYEKLLLELSDESRLVILSLKQELRDKQIYGVGKEFVGADVYEAVLYSQVTNLNELREYKNTRK